MQHTSAKLDSDGCQKVSCSFEEEMDVLENQGMMGDRQECVGGRALCSIYLGSALVCGPPRGPYHSIACRDNNEHRKGRQIDWDSPRSEHNAPLATNSRHSVRGVFSCTTKATPVADPRTTRSGNITYVAKCFRGSGSSAFRHGRDYSTTLHSMPLGSLFRRCQPESLWLRLGALRAGRKGRTLAWAV